MACRMWFWLLTHTLYIIIYFQSLTGHPAIAWEFLQHSGEFWPDMVSTCGIKEPGPRMTLLGDWAENSSGDGVPNITRSEHVFRKAAWIILVICGVGEYNIAMKCKSQVAVRNYIHPKFLYVCMCGLFCGYHCTFKRTVGLHISRDTILVRFKRNCWANTRTDLWRRQVNIDLDMSPTSVCFALI